MTGKRRWIINTIVTVLVIGGLLLGYYPGGVPTASAADCTYIVVRGDTLGKIAGRYGVSTADFVKANSLANANMIYVGQKLAIPGCGNPAPSASPRPQVPPRLPVITNNTGTVQKSIYLPIIFKQVDDLGSGLQVKWLVAPSTLGAVIGATAVTPWPVDEELAVLAAGAVALVYLGGQLVAVIRSSGAGETIGRGAQAVRDWAAKKWTQASAIALVPAIVVASAAQQQADYDRAKRHLNDPVAQSDRSRKDQYRSLQGRSFNQCFKRPDGSVILMFGDIGKFFLYNPNDASTIMDLVRNHLPPEFTEIQRGTNDYNKLCAGWPKTLLNRLIQYVLTGRG